jgi:hypothetical protein
MSEMNWNGGFARGETNMKSLFAAATVAALAFGFAGMATAAPIANLDGVHAGTSLVQETGYGHRHRHCAWRHGHKRCWWR